MIAADEIRTFAVFAETVSLSAAARALHLTQPAVHAHLKRLSERLGVPLYHRAGRALVLTREGVEVAAFAKDAVERAAAFEARLRGDPEHARVVLAAGPGALVHVLSAGIRAFARSHAGTLEILSADAAAAVEATLRGSAHVGVGAMGSVPDELEARLLTDVAQVLVLRGRIRSPGDGACCSAISTALASCCRRRGGPSAPRSTRRSRRTRFASIARPRRKAGRSSCVWWSWAWVSASSTGRCVSLAPW